MALDKQVSPDLRTAFSLDQALPLSPVTSNKGVGSAAPLPSQATDLLDALTKLYTHGSLHNCRSLKDGDNASSPDQVPFNIGACTLIRLCDYIKQCHDLNFYAWFEDKLRYEYTQCSSTGNIFTIKMPSLVHERSSEFIKDRWKEARKELVAYMHVVQQHPDIIKKIEKIECLSSPRIRHNENDWSEADATWAEPTKKSLNALFLLEVAVSESFEHLKNKARRLVEGIPSVQGVLGIKIYKDTPSIRAELWLWQVIERKNPSKRDIRTIQHKV
ncbi:MAG: hypothetical protein Q9207_002982 [Kuettlingeria erythrocarpa]